MKAIRVLVLALVRLAVLAAVIAAFAGVPLCRWGVKVQGLVWGVAATFVLGRFFCENLCPLGIVQGAVNALFHPKRHVRRVCTRLPETKAQRLVRWIIVALFAGLLVAGFAGPAVMLAPISIFGKAVSTLFGGEALPLAFKVVAWAGFGLVVVLAAIGRGRVWCNWICPFGTIYALVARFCLVKNRVGSRCANCRACFPSEGCGAAKASPAEDAGASGDSGVSRRETLKGVAVLAVTDKLTDGGYADVSLPGVPERGVSVLPPGAGDARAFARKCVACQLCITNCPGACLKPSVSLDRFGQPEMDFRRGSCIATCVKCGEVCPEGAIARLLPEDRRNVHLGHAEWKRDLCIRTTEKTACTACVRKCPVRAIHLVAGFPVIDRDKCIGCGACEHVCPARPQPAIYVKGHVEQRVVRPMGEGDLLAEMRSLVAAGRACVIAKNGVIVKTLDGRGVRPIVDELARDAKAFEGAVAYDKVVGRAAAAVYILGRAAKVAADVMSEGAVRDLESHGITALAATRVEKIRNRENTGECPMERLVANLQKPEEMVDALRKAIEKK